MYMFACHRGPSTVPYSVVQPLNFPKIGSGLRDYGCYRDSNGNANRDRLFSVQLDNVGRNGAVLSCAKAAAKRGVQTFGLEGGNGSDQKECFMQPDGNTSRLGMWGFGTDCNSADPGTVNPVTQKTMPVGGDWSLQAYEMTADLRDALIRQTFNTPWGPVVLFGCFRLPVKAPLQLRYAPPGAQWCCCCAWE